MATSVVSLIRRIPPPPSAPSSSKALPPLATRARLPLPTLQAPSHVRSRSRHHSSTTSSWKEVPRARAPEPALALAETPLPSVRIPTALLWLPVIAVLRSPLSVPLFLATRTTRVTAVMRQQHLRPRVLARPIRPSPFPRSSSSQERCSSHRPLPAVAQQQQQRPQPRVQQQQLLPPRPPSPATVWRAGRHCQRQEAHRRVALTVLGLMLLMAAVVRRLMLGHTHSCLEDVPFFPRRPLCLFRSPLFSLPMRTSPCPPP